MKLFVWNRPYSVKYGGPCLYVVAETIEQARQAALHAGVEEYGDGGGSFDPVELNKAIAAEPTRILEVPCAEIYQWSE